VDSLHDLAQKQERNSRRTAGEGLPFIHSSSNPRPILDELVKGLEGSSVNFSK